MIIIQYMLNYVNGKSYNVLRLILCIFVIFTFMISGEYSYCSGNKTFDVKYIPFGRYYILALEWVLFIVVFS